MSEQAATHNHVGASAEAIAFHYDKGDEFFRLWIGPDLIYSCALFDDNEPTDVRQRWGDLERAQLRKLDHHIAAADAAGKERVLDVGCGWGALLKRLVQQADVQQAVGLTMSPSQANWIRRMQVPGVEVHQADWREHRPDRPYNAIISIGAFEHFVRPGLSPRDKLDAYREFFAFCSRNLVSGGRLSLQTIAFVAPAVVGPFIPEKIFPESELPLIWEPTAAAQDYFELVALRNDRLHYYRTLRIWGRNLAARRAEAAVLVGAATLADFEEYLRTAASGFGLGITCLLRMSFVKRA